MGIKSEKEKRKKKNHIKIKRDEKCKCEQTFFYFFDRGLNEIKNNEKCQLCWTFALQTMEIFMEYFFTTCDISNKFMRIDEILLKNENAINRREQIQSVANKCKTSRFDTPQMLVFVYSSSLHSIELITINRIKILHFMKL